MNVLNFIISFLVVKVVALNKPFLFFCLTLHSTWIVLSCFIVYILYLCNKETKTEHLILMNCSILNNR